MIGLETYQFALIFISEKLSPEKNKILSFSKTIFPSQSFSTESKKYSVICVDFINSSLRFTRISDRTNVGEQDVSFRSGDDAAIRVLRRELWRHQKHVNQNVQTLEIGGLRSNDLKHSLESQIHRITCTFIVLSYIFIIIKEINCYVIFLEIQTNLISLPPGFSFPVVTLWQVLHFL